MTHKSTQSKQVRIVDTTGSYTAAVNSSGQLSVVQTNLFPGLPASYVSLQQDNSAINNMILYVGYALMGTATSAAGWQIQKILYDGNGLQNQQQWANVTSNIAASNLVWNNRASYTYS